MPFSTTHTYLIIVEIQKNAHITCWKVRVNWCLWLAWNVWEVYHSVLPPTALIQAQKQWGYGHCVDFHIIFILCVHLNETSVPVVLGLRGRPKVHVSKSFSAFLVHSKCCLLHELGIEILPLSDHAVLSSTLLSSQLRLVPFKYLTGSKHPNWSWCLSWTFILSDVKEDKIITFRQTQSMVWLFSFQM